MQILRHSRPEAEPNCLADLNLSEFQQLTQQRFIELMLRDATIELKLQDGTTVTGRIQWRNDPKCYCIVNEQTWVGLPRADLADVSNTLDLYVGRFVEKMQCRVVGELGPRTRAPSEGLNEHLESTVTRDQIHEDIRATHANIARMYHAQWVGARSRHNQFRS